MDCCPFFMRRKWQRRIGYHPLSDDAVGDSENASVTVVVGKEKRVFVVDPVIFEKDPFRVLLEVMRKKELKEKDGNGRGEEEEIFVGVDAILFEHMLWLMYNDCSSLFELNVEEIIEFYAQDS
ncbi:auxin-responsive protein SAUR78-like [Magnolia sinica]|uniref:auxin-responsive protein SAUR78-like n=1 Tax=Magnolia sinica TaxID=86752 RepID=UPI0026595B69|nr:auxin-responsive protein SAUR78-like [Magnolia sinica]